MTIQHESSLARNKAGGIPVSAMEPLREVSRRAGLGKLANQLSDLRTWMRVDLEALEAELRSIDGFAEQELSRDLAQKAAQHLLERPGKRIRPLCLLLGTQLAEESIDSRIRDLAISAELVHAATLLHDDVIDEGSERRGAPAARMVFGNSASILAGDYLLIEALGRVQSAGEGFPGREALLSTLLDTIREMVAAEAEQLERRGRFDPSRAAYLRIIEGKTASLFRWALQAGAVAAEKPESLIQSLGKVGLAIGMAFQLVDDLLDLEGDPEEFGKDLFADLEQGKLTWPVIVACEQDPEIEAHVKMLYSSSQEGTLESDDLIKLVHRIRDTGALEATREMARTQQQIAQEELSGVPDGLARRALETVIGAAVERSR